jgi:RND family efflux transporter MFP subunit
MFLELLFLVACGGTPTAEGDAPVPVRCEAATQAPVDEILHLSGPIRPPPDRDAPVAATASGPITALPVREGDRVDKGTVLAGIDDRPLRDALQAADASAAAAAARSRQAREAANRKKALSERGIVSRADAEAAEADAAEAEANALGARASLDTARFALDRAQLRSPIAGVVLAIHRRLGQVVDGSSNDPIVEVVDPSVLELVAQVPADGLARLSPGQSAMISVEGLEPLAATVASVAPGVGDATGLGVVRLRLDPGVQVPVGASGQAEVSVAHREAAILVPKGAVRGGEHGDVEVVACEGGRARVVRVKTGSEVDGRIEVEGELSAGSRVVVEGLLSLKDGALLKEAP